jgi:hypothetical protein
MADDFFAWGVNASVEEEADSDFGASSEEGALARPQSISMHLLTSPGAAVVACDWVGVRGGAMAAGDRIGVRGGV